MPAKNPRVNIVLDPLLYDTLGTMAARDGISMSLEAREDVFWGLAAAERAKTYSAKKSVSHKDIWK